MRALLCLPLAFPHSRATVWNNYCFSFLCVWSLWKKDVLTPEYNYSSPGLPKCGQPAFFRFPAHIPQAAVFYFWMDQRLFLWNYAIHFHYTFKCVSYLPADCLHSQHVFFILSPKFYLDFLLSLSLIWSFSSGIGGILRGWTPVQPYPLNHFVRARNPLAVENCFKRVSFGLGAWRGGGHFPITVSHQPDHPKPLSHCNSFANLISCT